MASVAWLSPVWNASVAGSLRSSLRRPGRALRKLILLTVAVISTISALSLLYVFVIAKLRFRWDLGWFDLGLYGFYRTQSYVSFDYESPLVEFLQWDQRCETGLIFFAPRGDSVAHPGPMILNSEGNLVWMQEIDAVTQDFRVQQYQGRDYLTYWAGDEVKGHGWGSWHMLDSSYTERYVVSAVGDMDGDLHEFKITQNDTALVTIYDTIPADLSSIGGPELGWILDGVFQEIDIATGELIFEWRASEHFPINSTFLELDGHGQNKEDPFDFFHINSVDKDPWGNYLVSARNTHTVSNIDSTTGALLWTLGGRLNEFTDLSGGAATNFSWQHDARWHGNNTLTVLDNSAHSHLDPARQSRGMAIELDIPARLATLRTQYYNPQEFKSISQGNLQVLEETGNVFIGWGSSAAFSEFSADGTLLCDVHFGASAYFIFGRVVSYRVFKGSWVGRPQTKPAARLIGNEIYVSWNGATEVAEWQLEAEIGSESNVLQYEVAERVPKGGFESMIMIPQGNTNNRFRVAALDKQGKVLGVTDVLERKSGWSNGETLLLGLCVLVGAFLVGSGIRIFGMFRGWYRKSQKYQPASEEYQPLALEEDSNM
ncbi:hypothetical protein VTN77DRAFT_9283 [Rasamsonia byssochlamydoides]|uniref:uncharacterized protein n=1 Tax=Rasamsonia byssochlamydoides TaxID=89139 RepID=UPI0037440D7D